MSVDRLVDIERALGHCTGHDAYAHDCTSCRASEISLARATGSRTADIMARQLAGAVARADAAEGELRQFQAGLTDALRAHNVPAMPRWADAIHWLARHGGQSS